MRGPSGLRAMPLVVEVFKLSPAPLSSNLSLVDRNVFLHSITAVATCMPAMLIALFLSLSLLVCVPFRAVADLKCELGPFYRNGFPTASLVPI